MHCVCFGQASDARRLWAGMQDEHGCSHLGRLEARDSMQVPCPAQPGKSSQLSKTIGMESTKSKDNLTKALLHDQTGLGRRTSLIRCSDLLYLCQTEVEDFA